MRDCLIIAGFFYYANKSARILLIQGVLSLLRVRFDAILVSDIKGEVINRVGDGRFLSAVCHTSDWFICYLLLFIRVIIWHISAAQIWRRTLRCLIIVVRGPSIALVKFLAGLGKLNWVPIPAILLLIRRFHQRFTLKNFSRLTLNVIILKIRGTFSRS